MKIAAIQTNPKHLDIRANLDEMKRLIAETEGDLLVFPELAVTGYLFLSKEEAFPYALHVDSSEVRELQDTCRISGKSIVFGHLELDGGEIYNSAVTIDWQGNILSVYRKTHLFHFERIVFSPGDAGFLVSNLTLQNGETVKLGVMICYDWRFPESVRSLALKGAQVVAVPSCIVTRTGMLHTVLQTRAFENKVILAFADRIGTEITSDISLSYRGESCVVNYNGDILQQLDDSSTGIVTAEIDIAPTLNKSFSELNDIFLDRRPDLYDL